MNLNKVQLIGRLTRDPELRTTPSGTSIVKFNLATNNIFKNKQGEKMENVQYHNCIIFGKSAETFAQYVAKGQEVYAEGRIEYRTFDKKDGTKGYSTDIVITDFQMGTRPAGNNVQKYKSENNEQDNNLF